MTLSDSLHRVLTLTVKVYTETLLKDKGPPDDPSDSLYQVLTPLTKAYAETLLKDERPPDGPSDSLYQVLTLKAYMENSP